MENIQALVVFRNVAQVYFPQSRVECHYSLTAEHHWSASDWIGLFQVGWTSLKDYHTYVWATAPEGPMIDYTEGAEVNSCALFNAFYLPHASEAKYQFVYVSERGEVRGQSGSFTFAAPKPLDELETLKEEQDGEELLLVVSRAQLLQTQLEECRQLLADVKQALETEKKEVEREKENSRKAKSVWEHEREAMKEVISELRENLRLSLEKLRGLEGRHQDVQYTRENMSSELSSLWTEKKENQQRIQELEDEIKTVTNSMGETDAQLERMKEREKKLCSQLKHEEEKRKSLQVENEASAAEVRVLRERAATGDHVCESLRRELCEAGLQRDHTHAELHQTRLHKAQLTLQMSTHNLAFHEARAAWAKEREAFRQAAETDQKKLQQLRDEVQQKDEWLQEERAERVKLEEELTRERDDDYRKCKRGLKMVARHCPQQVQLNYAKKEIQELKESLRNVGDFSFQRLTSIEKEKEQQQKEKQDLTEYVQQLEQKVESNEASFDSVEEEEKTGPVIVLTSSSHREVEKPLEFLTDTYTDTQEWRNKPLTVPQYREPSLSDNDIYMW